MRSRTEVLRRCWESPRLRRVLAAYLIFNIAEWANWVALLVWAYEKDGVRGSSTIALAQLLPAAVLAPVTATWLGRLPKMRALRLGYAAQAATMAATGAALLADASLAVGCVLAAAGLVSITLTRPVHYALLPEISDTTGELTAANAGSGSALAAATFIGPFVSGVLAVWWDPGGVLVTMAAASLVSVLLLGRLGGGERPHPRLARARRPTGETLRIVLRDPAARLLSGLVAAEYVLIGMLDILLVVMALELLGLRESGPGLLYSAVGIGGIIGVSLTIVLIGAARLAPALVAAALVAGVAFAASGLATSTWVAVLLLVTCGAGRLFFDVTLRTFVQRALPDHLLTAVFGLQESTMMAGNAVGALAAPLLVAWQGPRAAFVVAGSFLPLVALLGWPRLRRLDAAAVVPGDVLALLRGVDILEALAPRVVERLALTAGRETHAPGAAVVTEGELGDLLYVVESGEVVVSHGDDAIRRLGAGEYFGEVALLDVTARRTATVTARTEVRVVTVDRDCFLTALSGAPGSLDIADEHARDYR